MAASARRPERNGRGETTARRGARQGRGGSKTFPGGQKNATHSASGRAGKAEPGGGSRRDAHRMPPSSPVSSGRPLARRRTVFRGSRRSLLRASKTSTPGASSTDFAPSSGARGRERRARVSLSIRLRLDHDAIEADSRGARLGAALEKLSHGFLREGAGAGATRGGIWQELRGREAPGLRRGAGMRTRGWGGRAESRVPGSSAEKASRGATSVDMAGDGIVVSPPSGWRCVFLARQCRDRAADGITATPTLAIQAVLVSVGGSPVIKSSPVVGRRDRGVLAVKSVRRAPLGPGPNGKGGFERGRGGTRRRSSGWTRSFGSQRPMRPRTLFRLETLGGRTASAREGGVERRLSDAESSRAARMPPIGRRALPTARRPGRWRWAGTNASTTSQSPQRTRERGYEDVRGTGHGRHGFHLFGREPGHALGLVFRLETAFAQGSYRNCDAGRTRRCPTNKWSV